jgi:hypothetical protein
MRKEEEYHPCAVLKLTSDVSIRKDELSSSHIETLKLLKEEALKNNFCVTINDTDIKEIDL